MAVVGVSGSEAADQATESADALRPFARRAEAYDLFMQSLRLEDTGDVARAIELLDRAAVLDPAAAAIPAAVATLQARQNRAADAIVAAERALELDADYGEAHRVLGLVFGALADQAADQPAGRRAADDDTYRRRALTHLEQAVAAGVDDARVIFSLGQVYVDTRAFEQAVTLLEPFVRDRSRFVDGLLLLSRAYAGSGRGEAAIEVLKEAVRRRPRSVRSLTSLAELYEDGERWTEAAGAYARAVARRPSDVDLKRRWGATLLNAGDSERAREVIQEVVEARPGDGGALYLLSEIERRLNNFETAETAARRLMALEPDSARGVYALAQILLQRREYQELVDVVTPFIQRLRENNRVPRELAMLLVQSGASYQAMGDAESAIAAFELARDVAPDDPLMAAYLGQAYLEAGQTENAVDRLSDARERHPGDLRIEGLYARALVAEGHADQGIDIMQAAVAASPEDPLSHITLANLFVETGRVRDAVQALRDAESLFPEDTSILFQLGAIFEQQAQYADAERAFRTVLERDPSHHMTLNYLGYMLADRGERLEESVALIERALAADPHNGAYLDSLGWAYFKLEQWESSETYLRRASLLLIRNSVIQDHFGDVLFRLGRYAEAVDAWQRSLAGDADSIDPSAIERKIRDARESAER